MMPIVVRSFSCVLSAEDRMIHVDQRRSSKCLVGSTHTKQGKNPASSQSMIPANLYLDVE